MTQKSTTKPILRVYGKKPRASKTSKKLTHKGFNFFLHRSKAETGGHIMVYWDKIPYPCIKLLVYNNGDVAEDKAIEWIDNNLGEIIDKFQTLKEYTHVPKEFLSKITSKNTYKIVEFKDKEDFMKLAVLDINNEFVYVWCNLHEAPTKLQKGKRILDTNEIQIEYLRRKENV